MMRAAVTASDKEFIAARVVAFEREAPSEWRWQSRFVQQFGALPLFMGWTETLGIKPDGSLVRWSTEGEYEGLRSIERQVDANLALVEGAKRHSLLGCLIPAAPHDAIVCRHCHGTGQVRTEDVPLVCACGGVGWVLITETAIHPEPVRGGRELTVQERDLIRWMLVRGASDTGRLLADLAQARVVSRCPCGCASVDIAIPGHRLPSGGLRVVADFLFGDETSLAGVFVFERDGRLAGLEVYGLAVPAPAALPSPDELRPFDAEIGVAPGLKPKAG